MSDDAGTNLGAEPRGIPRGGVLPCRSLENCSELVGLCGRKAVRLSSNESTPGDWQARGCKLLWWELFRQRTSLEFVDGPTQ